jgi:hypothetical protein
MTVNRSVLIVGLLLMGMAQMPMAAQKAEDDGRRSKILALEHAWNQAEALKDLKALDVLFDNALVYVDFDGTLMTKAEFLSRVKTLPFQQGVTEAMTAQVFGETVIVTGIYVSKEMKNGKQILRRGRFVDAWVFNGSTWVCVSAQATPILP